MNMTEAVKSVLRQYAGFGGRARRSEFWFWVLALIIVIIIVAIIKGLLGLSYEADGTFSGLLFLVIFLPGLAVTFRRLHDIGRSGWWIGAVFLTILFYFLAAIGMALAIGANIEYAGPTLASFGMLTLVFFFGTIVYAIILLIFMCQDSQTGPNKYGPNPKNEGNYDVFE